MSMNVQLYPLTTSAGKLEDALHQLFDGHAHVIAVEIFDDPTARWSAELDTTIGPWVLGEASDVYGWLRANGHTDYETQYELRTDESA